MVIFEQKNVCIGRSILKIHIFDNVNKEPFLKTKSCISSKNIALHGCFFLFFVLSIHFFLYIYIIMIKLYKKITASILLMLISIMGVAQNSAGGGSGPPPPQGGGTPPPGLPIDDGLVVLLVAAVISGVYIILRHSKKHSQV